MTAAATTLHDPADWSDLSKPEYSGRIIDGKILGPIGNADYMKQEVQRGHPDYVMSRSEMKNFAKGSPREWFDGLAEEQTDEKQWGTMMDLLCFDAEAFTRRFCTPPVNYTDKESKRKNAPIVDKPWNPRTDICKEWKAEQEAKGITVISHDELREVSHAKRQLLNDETVLNILSESKFQILVTAKYEDFHTGLTVPVKGCIDIEPPRDMFKRLGPSLGDLKTTLSIHPMFQDRDVAQWWSDAQGSLYLDLYAAAGDERVSFFHILQKNNGNYAVGRRFLSEECLRQGREKYHAAMKLYCQCLKDNYWPTHEEMDTPRAKLDGFLATEPILNKST